MRENPVAIKFTVLLSLIIGSIVLIAGLVGKYTGNHFDLAANAVNGATGTKEIETQLTQNGSRSNTNVWSQNHSSSIAITNRYIALFAAILCCAVLLSLIPTKTQARPKSSKPLSTIELDRELLFDKRHRMGRILANNIDTVFHNRIEVRHVMSQIVTIVPPTMSYADVAQLMKDKSIRHLIVYRDTDRVVGIISDRDLKKREAKNAAELMTKDPLVVSPEMLVNPAVTTMINRHISCLPVVKGGKLCGILTTTDLMLILQCTLNVMQKLVIEFAVPHPSAVADSRTTHTVDRTVEQIFDTVSEGNDKVTKDKYVER